MFFRLFSRAPRMTISPFSGRPPRRRRRNRLLAAQIGAGQRAVPVLEQRLRPSLEDHFAAMLAGAGTEIDDVVGGADRLLVVFDDDDGVAEIAQPRQRRQQLAVVALMQPDRRLVEHVQHAGQIGADLRRQTDALSFAARQRRRAAIQREIADADVVQEAQPLADLPQHARGDQRLALGQLERLEHVERLADRQVHVVRDPATLHPHGQARQASAAGHDRRGTRAACDTARDPPGPPTSPRRTGAADSG